MATEKSFVAPPVSTLRKIMKPVISTDVMGNRNVEVRAVGARAEPAMYFTQLMNPEFCDAVKAAEAEEEKIRLLQEKKAARLKQFQEDVRRRVRQVNKTKLKQQLEKDYLSMEKHLDQVKSSLRASDCLTERKDRIVSHRVPAVSMHAPVVSSEADRLLGYSDYDQERRKKAFEKHNEQVHAFTSEARKKLSHRKVESDVDDPLPTGKWITFKTRGKPARMSGERVDEAEEENEEGNDDVDNGNGNIRDASGERNWNSAEVMDRLGQRPGGDGIKYFSLPAHSDHTTNVQEVEKEDGQSDEDIDERDAEDSDDGIDQAKLQRVKFNLRSVEARRPQSGTKRASRKKAPRRPTSAPDVSAGARELEERRRRELQKLNYHRLYSDLERQAVRDNQRRKMQRSQIRKIKKEKEEERRQEEDRTRRLVEPRDPITGETSVESDLRHQMERSHIQEKLQEKEEQRQKQREMIRYLDALRSNLREKLNKQGLELPALCCCGETLFDTHPETCANNCFYYKNHRAYARALQSLLTSSEVM